jgi:hypothetical protein
MARAVVTPRPPMVRSGYDVVHEVEELDAAPLLAAVTFPVATSRAANSVDVPLRL